MEVINPKKVFTEYRGKVTKDSPIKGRKYTMTHSDETADLFVTVGLNYAEDKVSKIRDEVRLEWIEEDGKLILYGEVLIDGEGISGNERIRNNIFMKEMPLALQSVRYGDRELFKNNEQLDCAIILIHFKSDIAKYDRVCNFGSMEMYRVYLV
ncbi:MAG: staygreen family protein [Clostridium sp.]|uniref:staygreen family protein n=1 Tax=Clostridium sp. TaxID=1506 RepID=UPI003F3EC702